MIILIIICDNHNYQNHTYTPMTDKRNLAVAIT